MVVSLGRPYGRGMTVHEASQRTALRRALLLAALLAGAAAIVLPGLARVGASDAPAGPPPPPNLAECRVADEPALAAGYDQWVDTLLDTAHTLGPGYVPPDLVLAEVPGRRIRLRAFVVPELAALLAGAAADGASIRVTSGYRSFERQSAILRELIEAEGKGSALLSAARPGHSEHQLGTTVDLVGAADWLRENAWRFGFVMSYPPGRSPGLTCYRPEVWHYRYFGRQRAAAINASGLSPREWLWQREPEPLPSASR
jgi:D-alanyl-D-alanine carboxypeptidase